MWMDELQRAETDLRRAKYLHIEHRGRFLPDPLRGFQAPGLHTVPPAYYQFADDISSRVAISGVRSLPGPTLMINEGKHHVRRSKQEVRER
jgi:hypothetical protein